MYVLFVLLSLTIYKMSVLVICNTCMYVTASGLAVSLSLDFLFVSISILDDILVSCIFDALNLARFGVAQMT